METSQRVALVTGGSRGIGAGIVRRLTNDGVRVAFTYLKSKELADDLARETGALAIQADSGAEDAVRSSVDETVRHFERLDVLVNNSYAATGLPIEQLPMAEFDRMFQVNVRGTWIAIQEALKHIGNGGRIVNIGSIFADHLPTGEVMRTGHAAYSMAKAGLAGMTRALARELAPKGITINTVQPGLILTDAATQEIAEHMTSLTPVGFGGNPADVAGVVAYLASLESRFVTGSTWDVDGGFGA
ncbi:SDR family oxidoreductase [Kibdelosporangium aridum]|uniref:SDR family oxidoreductase n=1 Tax=Kibdelosporangium aridum TaxID=2030 RepID=A0A428YVD4_KIBAR|nr:SDR family oxidoreductase [Kibdelosporangium aridum]RSM73836.1 SDR family oxidoreductase [Kibdelosporangium aridum]